MNQHFSSKNPVIFSTPLRAIPYAALGSSLRKERQGVSSTQPAGCSRKGRLLLANGKRQTVNSSIPEPKTGKG